MRSSLSYRAAGALLLLGQLGCSHERVYGICGIFFEDALLTIAQANDQATGGPISTIRLRNLSHNNSPITDLRYLVQIGNIGRGTTVVGPELECEIVCAFATQTGMYRFTVHHDGYRDTTIDVNAKYGNEQRGPAGCPTRLSRGVVLRVDLIPQ